MKLYVFNGSPNARKTLAAAFYLDLEIDVEWLDVTQGDLSKDSFLEVNPCGKVPVLQDGDLSVWESNAILVYLAVIGGGGLFPEQPRERANVLSWLFWEANHFNRAIGMFAWERVLKPAFGLGETDPTQLARAKVLLSKAAPVLERALEKKAFVMGEKPTIADFALAGFAAFIQPAQVPLDTFPAIQKWFARLDDLPAWRASAPDFTQLGRGGGLVDVA
ncbi:MAG: glutathione S-transferase family protein [Alphaproteobacteria bacterium]|nr:glutathione S-transferase family protein [Alphaproteobacteria bacterium]